MLVDNNLFHDRCPLCASRDIRKTGNIDYFQPLVFSTMEISLKHTPELWKCTECKSGFTQYAIPEQQSARLYEVGVGGERWVSDPFEVEKTREVIRELEKVFKPGLRVLDVGCNTGELLDFARSWGSITAGVEYSIASREKVKAKGHACFAALAEAAGPFDIIAAFDLVEHLYDVPAFFSDCTGKLSDKGQLIILTGNFSCFSSRMTGADWWYIRYPEHIVFPSKEYFSSLPKLSVVKWVKTYASTKFISSFTERAFTFVKGKQRGNYMALPSIVPDHVLMVLER
jgi:SAM-dependent methyltransferase